MNNFTKTYPFRLAFGCSWVLAVTQKTHRYGTFSGRQREQCVGCRAKLYAATAAVAAAAASRFQASRRPAHSSHANVAKVFRFKNTVQLLRAAFPLCIVRSAQRDRQSRLNCLEAMPCHFCTSMSFFGIACPCPLSENFTGVLLDHATLFVFMMAKWGLEAPYATMPLCRRPALKSRWAAKLIVFCRYV